jgi:putative phage-type endonuclease
MTAPVLDTPTGVLIGRFPVASPEWHAARLNGLGGSEIAAVLGLSPWESRYSLWHRKRGAIPPQPDKPEMEAGRRLEDAICQKFTDEHPEYIARNPGTLRHVDREWQIANPDALLYPTDPATLSSPWWPTAGLEAKFVLYADEYGEPGTDQVPPYVLAQCRWYLSVTGLPKWYVQTFEGSSGEFREYVILPDETDTATLLAAGEEFINSLAAGERPDIDEHDQTYVAVRQLHPDIESVDVEIDGTLARAYCAARGALKAAEAEAQLRTSQVADALGNGHRARFMRQTVATRQARGGGLPFLVVGRDLPDFTEETQP